MSLGQSDGSRQLVAGRGRSASGRGDSAVFTWRKRSSYVASDVHVVKVRQEHGSLEALSSLSPGVFTWTSGPPALGANNDRELCEAHAGGQVGRAPAVAQLLQAARAAGFLSCIPGSVGPQRWDDHTVPRMVLLRGRRLSLPPFKGSCDPSCERGHPAASSGGSGRPRRKLPAGRSPSAHPGLHPAPEQGLARAVFSRRN